METTRTCPQCQQPLAADAPDGLCPQCLLRAVSGPPPSASGDSLPCDIIDIGDPAEIGKKLPQFEILEMLGRGGMGVVYKARQLQLDRLVALKILPPIDALSADFVARFTREARALAKLNHPNIVNVYDFGETGGLYYIVMEYVDGANLRQLFEDRKLTAAEALAIVPKICDALQYAHEEGLVHRDIKPENLLLDKKGRVKIADFGLAKLLRREPLDLTLTLSGTALGTLRYMAPEQMDKPETVDHRADLYSLGVVIYEMLTGETPVGRFELPSQKARVDVRLDQIVLHALEREPARRYQHASEVRDDVEQITSKPGGAPASPASSTEPVAAAIDRSPSEASIPPNAGKPATENEAKLASTAAPLSVEPRLSRLALWGAIWAPLFFIALATFALAYKTEHPSVRMISTDAAPVFDGPPPGPAGWQILLSFTLLPLGALAPFGTTILGAIAMAQIKRSAGKLYGLRLAFADALLFPLIIASWIIGGCADVLLTQGLHFQIDPAFAISAAVALLGSFLIGRAVWRTITPAREIKPPAEIPPHARRAPNLRAWLLASCILGLLGCLSPYSILDQESFEGSHGSEINNEGVDLPEVDANSPAGKAGVIANDKLRSVGGRPVHVTWNSPDLVWGEMAVGSNVEIKLERGKKEIVLHAVRSPNPVGPRRYAQWQIIAGFSFLFFAVFVLLIPSFPHTARWRGVVAGLLGLATLLLVLVFRPVAPEQLLWTGISPEICAERLDLVQKLTVCAAALALLLVGVFDIQRVFGQQPPPAGESGANHGPSEPASVA